MQESPCQYRLTTRVRGGVKPYSYELIKINLDTTQTLVATNSIGVFIIDSTGNYYVEVIDANGCISDSTTVAVTIVPTITLIFTKEKHRESGTCYGTITADISCCRNYVLIGLLEVNLFIIR